MGMDVAFDATTEIRRALNLLSFLEESSEPLRSKDLISKLSDVENINIDIDNRKIITKFKKQMEEWKSDYKNLPVVTGQNGTRENPTSPFKFALGKEDYYHQQVYNELLRIAFALLLIKKGELGDLHNFLIHKKNPLKILMVLVNSITKNNSRHIKITFGEAGQERTLKVAIISIKQSADSWILECKDNHNNPVEIPFNQIINATP